jgi:phenylacetate-CoA ligase
MGMKAQLEASFRAAEIECLPREALCALQLTKLQRVLKRVYQAVPFYREKFDGAGIRVEEFHGLEQLPQLPFTYKSDLWANYPFGLLATPPESVVRVHASSGTKGRLTLVAYTQADVENWAELMARSLVAAGARPGMRVLNAYGYGLFTGGLGFHYGAERLPATVIPTSGGNTVRQLQLLEELQPEVLCCTPSFALTIADVRERNHSTRPLNLKIGVFGAEPWTEAMRAQIEHRLGLRATDTYGLSEAGGPGVAQECAQERNGLHIWEDFFLPEVIDPKTGEVLPPGQEGELVITTLEKEALPLIRYRTGDITALEPGICGCGRTHVRMRRVRGRRDDMLIIRGVNFYPSEVENVLLKFDEVLPFYEIVVDRPTALDRLTIRVECQPRFIDIPTMGQELAAKVQEAISDYCAVRADIELLPVGALTRSEGKALRVTDRRPKK